MSGDDSPGLLARLRAWLGSLVGESETPSTDDRGTAAPADRTDESASVGTETGAAEPEVEQATETTPAPYVCRVCGTDVADPAGGCPLCGSSDVRERGAASDEQSPGPSPRATASGSAVDGEASRLRELRGGATDPSADGDEGDTNGTASEAE